jgi:hypothetical protein
MKRATLMMAALALLFGGVGQAKADTITFGNLNSNPLTGSHTEGAFTYQVVSGSQWAVVNNKGNPASALTEGVSVVPNVGDTINFFLTGGGKFTFDSFDFASFVTAGSQGDTLNFIGQVGGVKTQQLLGIGSFSTTFQTKSPGFSAPIDTLSLVIASVGNHSIVIDNLVLTPTTIATPEPASLTLLGVGAVGLLGYGWRKRRRTSA